jgi:hypothetical protein
MGDGADRGRELPQRVRGTARDGPDQLTPSASPVLSEELRQRMQAAVKAERNQAAAREQKGATKATEPPPRAAVPGPADRQGKSPAVNGYHAQQKRAVKPEQPAKPQPARHASANHKPTGQGLVRTPDQAQADQARADQARADQARAEAEVPEGPRRRPFGKIRLVAFAVVFITIGALGVLVSRNIANSSSDNGALHGQELMAREQAASWVAQQVSQADPVACDPVMCAALEADKFPSSDLIVLSSNSSSYPLNSAVVVETATVRSLFGSSLANAFAPDALASFGSGLAEISVRVIAPHGAVAYRAALNADLADRENSGRALAGNTNLINFSGPAQNQLVDGEVDSRLILAITTLAGHQPIHILGFENIAPGGDPDLPLRFADLAANDPAANMSSAAYLKSMTAFLAAHDQAKTVIVTENGQSVVRIEFTAPSPFGVFNPSS